jgi:hypothetical protein
MKLLYFAKEKRDGEEKKVNYNHIIDSPLTRSLSSIEGNV